ncbi:MAG TPA: GyrI-like domain-containing protein [Coriobacteriia bacterium]|nr:GyrI-like domain-containing protein [Coriobacteriia bacterium]
MPALDLKKRFGSLYKPSAKVPVLVDVPTLRFLMVDGEGDIGGPTYQDAVQAIYGLAYPVKFEAKKRLDLAYPVMPLEGLYHDPAGEHEFSPEMRDRLAYTLMIVLPDEVSSEFVDEVRAKVAAKKDLARLADVRVQSFTEGPSVQIMHVGPYATEPATIARMLAFADERGYDFTGEHHEIYLGDPRRGNPDKLKTVLRYGVTKR